MGLGTALTVGALATLAMSAKGLASRLLGTRGRTLSAFVWWLEIAGALAVIAPGAVLFLASI